MKILLLGCLLFSFALPASSQNTLSTMTLATTDWCPYACENNPEKPGFIVEYLTEVLSQQGIELNIEFNPWHESVDKANQGKVDGLLMAVSVEAPNLLITKTPTAHYQACFVTKNDSHWLYKGIDSLENITLGAINGYGYAEPVNQYIKKNQDKDVLKIFNSNRANEFNNALIKNDIDAYLEDSLVVLWRLKQSENKEKLAGCLNREPFFLAVNPDREWAKDFIFLMNNALSENVKLQQLNAFFQKYRYR